MSEDKSNVIYFDDFIKEESEEDANLEFNSFDDVDYFLTSSESYHRKVRTLKEELENLNLMKDYLETALYSFENNEVYLEHMKGIRDDLKKRVKKEIPLTIASLITSIGGLYAFFATMDNITKLNSVLLGSLFAVIAAIGISVGAYYVKNLIIDGPELKRYEKEINKYQKLLTKKTK